MYSRIYPQAHSLHANATKRVDKLSQDVDDDIKHILGQDELELNNLYGSYFDQPKSNVSSKSFVSTKSGRPATIIFNKIKVFDDDDDDDVGNLDNKNGVEEVKFSHEINQETRANAELRAKYEEANAELEKVKFKYSKAKEHLKRFDNKVTELENKIESRDDENAKLAAEVQKNSRQTINMARLANNANNPTATNPALTQQVADMNKRAEEIRKALLSDENEEVAISFDDLFRSKNFFHVLYTLVIEKLTPFKRDIQQIQAKFGSSIASYFIFVRFVFLHMCIIAIVMAGAGVLHLAKMISRGAGILDLIMNYEGYLPMFMRYKTFSVSEGVEYGSSVMFVLVFILIVLCYKIVSEDRYIKDVSAVITDNSSPYSKEVLCVWDFSLATQLEVDDQHGALGNNYLQQLDATRTMGIKKQRTRYQTLSLYFRRALGFYMYLYLLALSTSAIIYLTINSQYIANLANSYNPLLKNVSSLITPFILTAINGMVPILIKFINSVEKWDTVQTELNVALFRSFLSNTLNSIILALSYLLLSDPYLLATSPKIRNGLQLQTDKNYPCRLDQASDGLFTLMLFSWAINLVTMYATPLLMKIGYEYILRKVWVKDEFNTADQMVKLLNFLGLVFMLFPFAPLAMVFVPFFLIINFKWEKYCVKHWYAKPKRISRGQSTGLVFTFFYLATFVLLGCTMGFYFLTSKSFVKNCDIQDLYVGLCNGDVFNDDDSKTTGECVMDTDSPYYSYFSGEKNEYPHFLCKDQCGPFVQADSNFTPLKDRLLGKSVLYVVWKILFFYPYVPWFIVVVMSIVIAVKANSMNVLTFSSFSREKEMEAHIATIEADRKRQEKTIKKLKQLSVQDEQKEA